MKTKTDDIYLVDAIGKKEVRITNLKETKTVDRSKVQFLDFNKLYAIYKN